MPKRTEEQKVISAPIKVILGGQEYGIPPLVIRDSILWRQKVIPLLIPLPKALNTKERKGLLGLFHKGKTEDVFGAAIKELLVTMPNAVLDLFFDYAKDLNRKEIEEQATEAEVEEAFNKILEIAFPLARSLPGVVARLSR